ncbi:hypothetical protein HOF56_02915 [Candidatus Peribacteria bacterium]|jgi:hypothetical protein|nr:hypothetical protein [Candidatus Peribacteria bacterium]MBT4020896.1 hypothetical protein [Candidatus Peribacteria bacterium]MBT4240612.1 hypothetical protein [Candidatus Peribacteria bacterium]MBT4474618.1 hypothetical protein [Candidatus Peribacteria bacterium]
MSTATAIEEPPELELDGQEPCDLEKTNKHVLDATGLEDSIDAVVRPRIRDLIQASLRPSGVTGRFGNLLSVASMQHTNRRRSEIAGDYIKDASLTRDALELIRNGNNKNAELIAVIKSLLDLIYDPNRLSLIGAKNDPAEIQNLAEEIIASAKELLSAEIKKANEADPSLRSVDSEELNRVICEARVALERAKLIQQGRKAEISDASSETVFTASRTTEHAVTTTH